MDLRPLSRFNFKKDRGSRHCPPHLAPKECDSLLQNFDLRAEVRRNAKKKHEKHGILDMFYHVLTMNIDG